MICKSLIIKFLSILILFLFSLTIAFSEELYKDNFSGGKPQLRWAFFPHFNLDNLEGIPNSNAPDGDGGIGILRNSNVGGFASLSYAVTKELENFYLEAMIYCEVHKDSKGPLSGIAFLIDPIKGSFYRVVCDFKGNDPNINLAYVGIDSKNYPVYLKFWGQKDIPSNIPKESGWQSFGVRVRKGRATIFFNGKELSGGPFVVDRIKKGFAGVYTNFVGGFGEASTKIDKFILKEDR
ncbi:MAG: hypothetical protein N2511_01325 [Thermodesulfovibrionales bacterium]|nr:hypothetical protein [Thermodesulfovibrionales bacterium]